MRSLLQEQYSYGSSLRIVFREPVSDQGTCQGSWLLKKLVFFIIEGSHKFPETFQGPLTSAEGFVDTYQSSQLHVSHCHRSQSGNLI